MFRMISLYFKLVGVSFRSQMQHKASFLMLATSHFISTFVDIFTIWLLFDRFKMVQGWTIKEVALIYGIIQMGFAAAESTARGFDKFSDLVKYGDFDRVLLRPIGTLIQVAVREIQLLRIGRFLQGLVVLLWGCEQLKIPFISYHAVVIFISILGTYCLFYGLFILQGTISFWTTETLELMNILTFGGMEAGQFPLSIYKPGFRLFFTFVVPLACVGYYPIAILLRHETFSYWLGILFPIIGVLFLLMATQVWKFGVKHYHSTGN